MVTFPKLLVVVMVVGGGGGSGVWCEASILASGEVLFDDPTLPTTISPRRSTYSPTLLDDSDQPLAYDESQDVTPTISPPILSHRKIPTLTSSSSFRIRPAFASRKSPVSVLMPRKISRARSPVPALTPRKVSSAPIPVARISSSPFPASREIIIYDSRRTPTPMALTSRKFSAPVAEVSTSRDNPTLSILRIRPVPSAILRDRSAHSPILRNPSPPIALSPTLVDVPAPSPSSPDLRQRPIPALTSHVIAKRPPISSPSFPIIIKRPSPIPAPSSIRINRPESSPLPSTPEKVTQKTSVERRRDSFHSSTPVIRKTSAERRHDSFHSSNPVIRKTSAERRPDSFHSSTPVIRKTSAERHHDPFHSSTPVIQKTSAERRHDSFHSSIPQDSFPSSTLVTRKTSAERRRHDPNPSSTPFAKSFDTVSTRPVSPPRSAPSFPRPLKRPSFSLSLPTRIQPSTNTSSTPEDNPDASPSSPILEDATEVSPASLPEDNTDTEQISTGDDDPDDASSTATPVLEDTPDASPSFLSSPQQQHPSSSPALSPPSARLSSSPILRVGAPRNDVPAPAPRDNPSRTATFIPRNRFLVMPKRKQKKEDNLIGKSPCPRGNQGQSCRRQLALSSRTCNSGDCQKCRRGCTSLSPSEWPTCCRDHLLCCRHLATACLRCDEPQLQPFCSAAFKKCS